MLALLMPGGAMPRPKKVTPFHYHEAADRAILLCDMIETHLLDHPVIKNRRALFTDAADAQRLLFRIAATCGPAKKKKS